MDSLRHMLVTDSATGSLVERPTGLYEGHDVDTAGNRLSSERALSVDAGPHRHAAHALPNELLVRSGDDGLVVASALHDPSWLKVDVRDAVGQRLAAILFAELGQGDEFQLFCFHGHLRLERGNAPFTFSGRDPLRDMFLSIAFGADLRAPPRIELAFTWNIPSAVAFLCGVVCHLRARTFDAANG